MKNILLLFFVFISCKNKNESLPYLGNTNKKTHDEEYFAIPPFEFLNQDSIKVNNATLKGKIYIADFIFLNCPTICPIMNRNLKQVYDVFKNDNSVLFISHTIDPENDSIPILKKYAISLGVTTKKWHFLHGNKKEIYNIAENGYYSKAYEDKKAPGGYAHSGGFLLIDKSGHIRGVYDGTDKKEVDRLIKEIVVLQKELR